MSPFITIRNVVCYQIRPDQEGLPESEQIKIRERAKELGVSILINTKTGELSKRAPPDSVPNVVDPAMYKKAKKIESLHAIFFTKEKDARNAIDFLELFIVHSADYLQRSEINRSKFFKENGVQALDELEMIRNQMSVSKSKSILKPTVDVVLGKINNLFTILSISEKQGLIKSLRSAKKILKNYFK